MYLTKQFLQDESGAVTIDWVVLTSGIVILGVIAVTPLLDPISALAGYIRDSINAATTFID